MPPPPGVFVNIALIPAKTARYWQKHHLRWRNDTILFRKITAHILLDRFEQRPREIAHLLKTSTSTVHRDIKDAQFLLKKQHKTRQLQQHLIDFLLYNAKYIR